VNTGRLLMTAIAALGLAGPAAGWADESKRSFGEYADDKIILGKVKSALIGDSTTEAHEINVEVNKGVVQLSGFVDTEKEKAHASEVAGGVDGVKSVENKLLVKTASSTTGETIDDTTITAKVKTALIESPATKASQIKVETKFGVVQLSGFVDDQATKDAAAKVAQAVKGVKSVDNALTVKAN
jgi:hyperosmotically inducible periplasmic protein